MAEIVNSFNTGGGQRKASALPERLTGLRTSLGRRRTAFKWFNVPDPTVQGPWKLTPGERPWIGLLNATAVPFV